MRGPNREAQQITPVITRIRVQGEGCVHQSEDGKPRNWPMSGEYQAA